MFKLTCDSTVDLPQSYLDERDIEYVSLQFVLNGKTYADDQGQSLGYPEFYQMIREGAMPTTSQVNIKQYIDFFEPMLKRDESVLHIGFSSALSGSYSASMVARNELLEKYPEAELLIIDSLGASCGHGMLVDMAADLRDQEIPLEEAFLELEQKKLHIHHWFFTTDLTHLKRGGRVSPAAAAFGSLLNICPLMNISNEGKLTPREKIRGKKKVMEEMVNRMEKHAGADYSGKVFISHSDCLDDAKTVAGLIENRFPHVQKPIRIEWVGSVIGSHTGPGTVALFFLGDERVD